MKKLCAACGSLNEIRAACACECDEIVLIGEDSIWGRKQLSASELPAALDMAKEAGRPVSVLFDRLFSEDEIADAQILLREMLRDGAEAVWVSDPGLMQEDVIAKLIYQPGMLVTDSADAAFWMKCGCLSAAVSPLLTFEELYEIVKKVPDLSVMIHGCFPMSVSGRKLISAYEQESGCADLSGRSDLSLIEEKRSERMPVKENAWGTVIFNDRIQESFEEVRRLRNEKISRFVIFAEEGTEYLCDTIRLYRKILDEKDSDEDLAAYRERWQSLPLSKSYYMEKTIK
ncbi:MAG: U32 family peptidase [Solobacterium sp.]|nr:U32 family peptidase [Solobacterium sp.]